MKKRLHILLTALALVLSLVSCGEKEEENNDSGKVQTVEGLKEEEKKAARAEIEKQNKARMTEDEIRMYFGKRPADFDPSVFSVSSDKYRITSLIFEGLTGIDGDGKVYPLGAESWSIEKNTDGNTVMTLNLRETAWSDGVPVRADDYVYAFRKILRPGNTNTAYSLLAPILNAADVKSGAASGSELGVYSIDEYVLEITFEKDFSDTELFLRNLASPVLVPLREDAAEKEDWTENIGLISKACNGPFAVKSVSDGRLMIDRNVFYKNAPCAVAKRIHIYFDDKQKAYESFGQKDGYYYLENVSKDTYTNLSKNAVTVDEPSVYAYFFNVNSEPLSDAETRKFLSSSLDREKISQIRGCGAVKATGIVPQYMKEDGTKDVLSGITAKKKPNTSGNITLSYNVERDYEGEIAEYAKNVWEEAGFNITLNPLTEEELAQALKNGDFDIAAMDLYSPTSDAFGMLAPFALEYSGSFVDVTNPDVFNTPHFTTYNSDEYNTLIARYYGSGEKERKEILSEAEEILLRDAVTAPLFFDKNTYITKGLNNVASDSNGFVDMKEVCITA